jgi:hypothetical protein
MRKFYMITFLAFLFIGNIIAQDVLVVEPGLGTLNAAITANGGNKIYQLTAGEWYGLDAPIENVDYHLQIIGSEPAVAGGKPATLQTGTDVNGATFAKMFDAKGDITLKNIFFVGADLNGQVETLWLEESKKDARIVIDRCVFLPSAVGQVVTGSGGNNKCYFTNNLAIDHGHMLSPNDGHFFNFSNTAAGAGLDTLWVENNTFVCVGMNLFQGSFGDLVNNVVAFNHNTFIFAKSQIDWTTKKMEEYWTNNLMFDLQVDPYANNWQPMPGGDPSMPKPNLIYADTLKDEVMPSTRPNFVQYNSLYRAQGFYDLVTEMNAFCAEQNPKLPGVYLYPMVWPRDTLTSREAQMFGSTDFPKFKYGHEIEDVDPQWNDATIYDHETDFIAWASPANYVHALGQPPANYPPATEWAQYWWIPSGDLSDNSVWPVFDGTYANEQYMKGSIELNVPLGDLNWWPEAKTAWEAKKADVWAHIQAGNTEQIDIGYGQALDPAVFPITFETATDAVWTVFGTQPDDQTALSVVDNPDKTGLNTSDKTAKMVIPTQADPWAGFFSDSYPTIEFTEASHTITMMVWKDNTNPVGIKVESPTNGGTVTEVKIPVTESGKWIEVSADFSAVVGFGFARLTIFPDFPDTRTAGATVYIDNIALAGATGTVDIKADGLFVYPNPVSNVLNVKGAKNADITIINIDGRVVRNVSNVSSVDVSDLAKGIYSVKIRSGNEVSTQKVVISR